MQHLHDIWVNWVEGGSRAYQIPEFFEWKKTDNVDLMDTIPLIVVEPELFSFIEDGYTDIPKELLDSIYNVAKKRIASQQKTRKVQYCFVMTDKKRVLAVEAASDLKPNYKSRLNATQERSVLERAEYTDVTPYEIADSDKEGARELALTEQILASDPAYFVGLTRTEKAMKEILFDWLFELSCSENDSEVYYWYTELFPKEYSTDVRISVEWMLENMFNFIKKGWSQRHVDFGTQLVKYRDYLVEDWNDLLKQSKSLDMLVKAE